MRKGWSYFDDYQKMKNIMTFLGGETVLHHTSKVSYNIKDVVFG